MHTANNLDPGKALVSALKRTRGVNTSVCVKFEWYMMERCELDMRLDLLIVCFAFAYR